MSDEHESPVELMTKSRNARQQGKEWLAAGLGIGAMGVVGAVAGAVCPVCVVATPAFLGAGLVRTLWSKHLEKKALDAVKFDQPTTDPVPSR
jgi:hypothetical protein